jgi:hypothetical protein
MRYRTISDIFPTKNVEQAKKEPDTIPKTRYMNAYDILRWAGAVMAGGNAGEVLYSRMTKI